MSNINEMVAYFVGNCQPTSLEVVFLDKFLQRNNLTLDKLHGMKNYEIEKICLNETPTIRNIVKLEMKPFMDESLWRNFL